MNYRIAYVTYVMYQSVSQEMQAEAQEAGQTYDRLRQRFFDRGFIFADSFVEGMNALGNETAHILYDVEALQKLWADENDVSFRKDSWKRDIAIAQLQRFRPDVVFIQSPNPDSLINLVPDTEFRELCPSVRLVAASSGYPQGAEAVRWIDLLFAGSRAICAHYRQGGADAQLAYHAFDERIIQQLANYRNSANVAAAPRNFTFLGSTGCGFGETHRHRYFDLVHLLAGTPLEIWGFEPVRHQPSLAASEVFAAASAALHVLMGKVSPVALAGIYRHILQECFGSDIPIIPLATLFPDRCHAPLFGISMYDHLARSHLTFNRHADASGGDVGNMRMFHATGLGTCLLTDDGENMGDLFEPNKEVVVYSSVQDCVEKAQYLLAHSAEREAIAAAGHQRTMRDHTYRRRCAMIHDAIVRALH